MYLEQLKRVLSTERGLQLTFSSGDKKCPIEMSPEAADAELCTLFRLQQARVLANNS